MKSFNQIGKKFIFSYDENSDVLFVRKKNVKIVNSECFQASGQKGFYIFNFDSENEFCGIQILDASHENAWNYLCSIIEKNQNLINYNEAIFIQKLLSIIHDGVKSVMIDNELAECHMSFGSYEEVLYPEAFHA